MTKHKSDGLDQRWVRALSHSLRVRILEVLGERPGSPVQMAEILNEPLPNVAYHCRVLLEVECIELLETRPVRGAVEHIYRAVPQFGIGSRSWQAFPPSLRGGMASTAVDGFVTHAIAALKAGTFETREGSTVSWSLLTVDEAGWGELLKVVEIAEKHFHEIAKKSAERLQAPVDGIPVVAAVAAFEPARSQKGQKE